MSALAVLYGLFLWAAAVAIQFVMGPWPLGGATVIGVVMIITVPLVWGLLALYWKITLVLPADRPRIGALISAPGLLLTAGYLLMEPAIFGWPPVGVRVLAAWLFWVHGLALVISLRSGKSEPITNTQHS